MPLDSDPTHLHGAFYEKMHILDASIKAAGLPHRLYEGARTPWRQAELYSRGRATPPMGKTVTKARAWGSFHQYGMAADFVPIVNGKWDWLTASDPRWAAFTDLAHKAGLRTLSFEMPHVELPLNLSDLRSGRFPANGGASWQSWIDTQIEGWGAEARAVNGIMMPGAPPLQIDRPVTEVV